ncbi:MAG: hypothetical protein JW885_10525 [Deltaproteobacteria bacterium]|nr:hypothetical protein [Candidatus Zymogenaceae bacterium]
MIQEEYFKSLFEKYIRAFEPTKVKDLLMDYLDRPDIVCQSNYGVWAKYTRFFRNQLLENFEYQTCIDFHEELLDFFKKVLEPKYGHIHKGEILWQLGSLWGPIDINKSKEYLLEAKKDNEILEKIRDDHPSKGTSTYTKLCIIDRIEEGIHFTTEDEKRKFFGALFTPAFNAAIYRAVVNPEKVKERIKTLINSNDALIDFNIIDIYDELSISNGNDLKISTVTLTGILLESIVMALLKYKYEKDVLETKIANKKTKKVKLEEAKFKDLLENIYTYESLNDSIKVTFDTIRVFRNRLHPGREWREEYKLTKRVARTLKNIFDLALHEWANS